MRTELTSVLHVNTELSPSSLLPWRKGKTGDSGREKEGQQLWLGLTPTSVLTSAWRINIKHPKCKRPALLKPGEFQGNLN